MIYSNYLLRKAPQLSRYQKVKSNKCSNSSKKRVGQGLSLKGIKKCNKIQSRQAQV
jgi:hypothetical protein